MKLCITSSGPNIDDTVDPRFGRCQYFIILNTDTMQFESFDNSAMGASGGAGIQAARFIADQGAEAVLTGNVGPNAYNSLQSLGIKILTGISNSTVKEAADEFKSGKYKEIGSPSVQSHFGMGGGRGRGMGMGTGRGMGRGMGQGMGAGNVSPDPQQDSSSSGENELNMLKDQSKQMQEELAKMQKRIEELSENK